MKKLMTAMLLLCAAMWNVALAQEYEQGEALLTDKSQITCVMQTGQDIGKWLDGDLTNFSETKPDQMPSIDYKKEITFNLGRAVRGIYFNWVPRNNNGGEVTYNDAPKNFDVYVSADGETWGTAVKQFENVGGKKQEWYSTGAITFDAAYQYVKIHFTANHSSMARRWNKFDLNGNGTLEESEDFNGVNEGTHPVPYISFAELQMYEALEVGSIATITWQVKDGENVICTLQQSVKKGTEISAHPAELDRAPYFNISDPETFTVTDDVTVDLKITTNWTFGSIKTDGRMFSKTSGQLFTSTIADARWYNLKNANGSYYLSVDDNNVICTPSRVSDSHEAWAFVGNPYDGFYLYNLSKILEGNYVLATYKDNYNASYPKPRVVEKGDVTTYAQQVWTLENYAPWDGTQNKNVTNYASFIIRPKSAPKNAFRFDWSIYLEANSGIGWGDVGAYPTLAAIQGVSEVEYTVLGSDERELASAKDLLTFADGETEKTISEIPIKRGYVEYAGWEAFNAEPMKRYQKTVTATYKATPIAYSETLADAKWMQLRRAKDASKYLTIDENYETVTPVADGNVPSAYDPSSVWAFVGNPIEGFTIYNYKTQLEEGKQNYVLGAKKSTTAKAKLVAPDDETYSVKKFYFIESNTPASYAIIADRPDFTTTQTCVLEAWNGGRMTIVPNGAGLGWGNWNMNTTTFTIADVSLNEIGAASYATMCLPYAVELDDATNAYALELSSGKEDGVYYADLAEVEGVVPANTGVLLIGDGAAKVTVKSNINTGEVSESNALVGTLEDMAWNADDLALGRYEGVPGFYKWSGTTLKAYKAYIPASKLPGAGVREIVFRNGETTGIGAALNGSPADAQGAVYDLQGRRVGAAKSGLYIVNGKKVFIK